MVVTRDGGEDGDLGSMVFKFLIAISCDHLISDDDKYHKRFFLGFDNAVLRSRLCFQYAVLWNSSLDKNGPNEKIVMAVLKLNKSTNDNSLAK